MLVLNELDVVDRMARCGIHTRQELAGRMGILPTHLTAAINGRVGRYGPGAKVVDRLCAVLECQPGELLEHVGDD